VEWFWLGSRYEVVSSKRCSSASIYRPKLVQGPEMVEKAWSGWVGLLLRIGQVQLELFGCWMVEALFLMRTLKFRVHERTVRDSRRWLRPST
jgi:hypothetical protein